jgi:hypothetical protein
VDEALTLAQALLAEGRAFSAHEVLEAVWKAAPEDERDLWQGMAQICVGITHAHRGNRAGASRLVQRGAGHLSGYAGQSPYGIDVDGLMRWCRQNAADPSAMLPQLRAVAQAPDAAPAAPIPGSASASVRGSASAPPPGAASAPPPGAASASPTGAEPGADQAS